MKVLICIFFLSNFVCNSQKLVCTYSVKVDSLYFENNKLPIDNFYNYMDYVEDLYYLLEIKDEVSLYYISDYSKKKLSGPKTRIVQNIGGKGLYYASSRDSVFLNQKEFFGEIFLIEQKVPKWNLINESKIILVHDKKYN